MAVASGAAAALICGTAIVPLKRLAVRWDLTDRPSAKKAHARPTPYVGGIGIMLGTFVPALALPELTDRRVIAILLGATVVGLLGLIDDIRPLPPVTRLVVETVAAVEVVLSGVHVTLVGGWLDGVATVVWLVVLANSFNLLDNMDGVLGSVATVTAAFLAVSAFVSAQTSLALLMTVLTCATLGFLKHNWPRARVFMGDSGSLFIGFLLSCSAVLLMAGQGPPTLIAGLLLPTFVATVDTGVVLVSRLRAGHSPLRGGTDHVSHRLRRLGLPTWAVAAGLGLIAAILGGFLVAMALRWTSPLITAMVTVGTAVVLIILLQGVNAYPSTDHAKSSSRIRERRR
ncbi:MraY family glycosyltransferase [Nonomuraea helvata]|uniref:MraY family glycosyltransferase n=2 Tax=Nonomuraea helvata TaxID=37484 RepID=A0ABV5S6J1_9ACTN